MRAALIVGHGRFEIDNVSIPTLQPGEILVKVIVAAQNPTDWKSLIHASPGNILGSDFAGVVVQLGPGQIPTTVKLGSRVAGLVHSGGQCNGAFAEFVSCPAELVILLPDHISFEHGAQLPTACITACQCLYQELNMPKPCHSSSSMDILIWSGTSATGFYAIQLAKLAGMHIITTASPGNFDLVRSIGADEVFDHGDSNTARRIHEVTNGQLHWAVDCRSEGTSPYQVSMSLSESGGKIASVLPYTSLKPGVETCLVLAYSVLGKDLEFPFRIQGKKEYHNNAISYCQMLTQLLEGNRLLPMPTKLFPNGLDSLQDGIEYMRLGKVHAEKIIYQI